MGKSKLEKRVGEIGRLVVALMVMVIVMGGALMLSQYRNQTSDAERVERWVEAGGWTDERGTPIPSPSPAVEPASDELISATLNNYANLEASRMAKRAAVLMGMGGTYTAECRATYKRNHDSTSTWYSITWMRGVGTKVDGGVIIEAEEKPITRSWGGNNWAECIQKMLAWKGGE